MSARRKKLVSPREALRNRLERAYYTGLEMPDFMGDYEDRGDVDPRKVFDWVAAVLLPDSLEMPGNKEDEDA